MIPYTEITGSETGEIQFSTVDATGRSYFLNLLGVCPGGVPENEPIIVRPAEDASA